MVSASDVLVDNWGPGALERLGLGYGRLREINQGLIYATITGYGDNGSLQGPYSSWPANKLVVKGRGGRVREGRSVVRGDRDGSVVDYAIDRHGLRLRI